MLIGIVPMGGSAERWSPYPCPKELLPFGANEDCSPKVIGDYILERMAAANVEMVVLPVKPAKAALLMQYFGSRTKNGAPIVYIPATGATMLANIKASIPIIKGHGVLFGMPDTYFLPEDAFSGCLNELEPSVELVLGSFFHESPDQLDLVERKGSRLMGVKPKPRLIREDNNEIWGIAAWNSSFTIRLECDQSQSLGDAFHSAALDSNSRCVFFEGGEYIDLASYDVYSQALLALMR
jgi:glucose-1-phosphate thymidylyltransferase